MWNPGHLQCLRQRDESKKTRAFHPPGDVLILPVCSAAAHHYEFFYLFFYSEVSRATSAVRWDLQKGLSLGFISASQMLLWLKWEGGRCWFHSKVGGPSEKPSPLFHFERFLCPWDDMMPSASKTSKAKRNDEIYSGQKPLQAKFEFNKILEFLSTWTCSGPALLSRHFYLMNISRKDSFTKVS